MKIHIRKYTDNWISPYTAMAFFSWKKKTGSTEVAGSTLYAWLSESGEIDDSAPPAWLSWVCNKLCAIRNKLTPCRIKIKIDKWDTYNMYGTLAIIIAPMLRQLKDTKHGSPAVDDAHVPIHLRSFIAPDPNKYDDSNLHARWDFVLDEMIWAFNQLENDNLMSESEADDIKDITADHVAAYNARLQNGLTLFGIYYQSLWD